MKAMRSRRGVQQGCSLGPFTSDRNAELLWAFRDSPQAALAQVIAFMNYNVVMAPSEEVGDMTSAAKVSEWFQGKMRVESAKLNSSIFQVLLADRAEPRSLPIKQYVTPASASSDIAVARRGIQITGSQCELRANGDTSFNVSLRSR